nr:hypothetical protein [Tanacetum cinerariifolium]
MRTEYCLSERKRLETESEKQVDLLKVKDVEIKSLKAQLLLKETDVVEAVHLCAQVFAGEAIKKMHASEIDTLKQKNVAFENEKGSLDGKVAELQSLVSTKDLELKELNTVVHELEATCSGLRGQVLSYEWLKEQIEEFQDAQMNIINDKVVKLDEYLSTLGAAISCAIKKGMQDRLSAGNDHGKAGRSLEDVAAYNPSAEADYTPALHRIREVDFPLLSKLKSHKDASIADVMDLLCLEVILGETYLLVAFDVTHLRVERIRENVAAQRSALIGVWTLLVNPLSVENLVGVTSTSVSMPLTVATTTTLSITFAFASVERLFDEGGSADQGGSAARGGHDADIESATGVRFIAAKIMAAERPKRPRKKRHTATYASGSSYPPKKLSGDYKTSIEAAISGKSLVVLKELLASSMLNVEAGVAAVVTLPMVTSSVSATSEQESGLPTDSITELNLRTFGLTERFVISLDSSHHSSTNAAEAGIDCFFRYVTPPLVMTEAVTTTNVASIPSDSALETGTKVVTLVHALMFPDSDSTGT